MNKQRYLLLALALLLIFAGGFFSGMLFTSSSASKNQSVQINKKKVIMAPDSKKVPRYKAAQQINSLQPKVFTGYGCLFPHFW